MGGAIISEIRKIFTTRLWWGMALGMAVLAALISAGFAALVGLGAEGMDEAGNPFARMSVMAAQLVYNAGAVQGMTTLFPLALGVLLITQEYRHQTISATFLSTPSRTVVLLSKLVSVVVIGAIYAVIHAVASLAGGVAVLGLKGQDLLLGEPEVWQSLGVSIIAFVVWTLLGFGFGMLVRNQIAAVLIAVGVAFIAQIALNIIFSIKEWWTPMKLLPGNLTSNMLITAQMEGDPSGGMASFPHWWQAALVLVGYALVLSVAGAVLTARRDVS